MTNQTTNHLNESLKRHKANLILIEEASAIIDNLGMSDRVYEPFAEKWSEIEEHVFDLLKDHGLITQEQIDNWDDNVMDLINRHIGT